MAEGEKTRLVAWSRELSAVHVRLHEAVRVTQSALEEQGEVSRRELLLYCHGFCTALKAHHEGEDRDLFPAVAEQHPELGETLRYLVQDHSMIAHLLGGLQAAVDRSATPDELDGHLEGVAAIMESHFRYEERAIGIVLETLALEGDPSDVLGPL